MRAGGAAATLLRKSPMLTNASSSMFDCMLGDLTEGKLRVREWWRNVQLQTGDDQYDISYQSGSCSSVHHWWSGTFWMSAAHFQQEAAVWSQTITERFRTLRPQTPSTFTAAFMLLMCFSSVIVRFLIWSGWSSSRPPPPVLVRYVRADGKIHTVNLQNANVADGRTHSIILRLGGLRRDNMHLELYVNCRLADSSQGLPPLVPLPREAEMVEIRHGQKAYARLQVRKREREQWGHTKRKKNVWQCCEKVTHMLRLLMIFFYNCKSFLDILELERVFQIYKGDT